MKNLLIWTLALIVVCLAVSSASAEPTNEKYVHVTSMKIRNTETNDVYFQYDAGSGDKLAPITVIIKSCADNVKYDCVYVGRKSKPVTSYLNNEYRRPKSLVSGYVQVTYTYQVAASADLPETRVIVTPTKVAMATCKDILSFSRNLPVQERLARPGLLQQVADCTR